MILGKFLKVSEVSDGDLIMFTDEGEWVESTKFKNPDGSFKQMLQFTIELPNGESRTFTVNKINKENLVSAWGRDTKKWIRKSAEIILKEGEVGGEIKTLIRLKPSEE